MSRLLTGILVLALGTGTALAQQTMDTTSEHAHDHAATSAATPSDVATPQTEGEIRKVDAAAQKLTVKHGRIENLGMSPMTMVYPRQGPSVPDPGEAGRHGQDDSGAYRWRANHRCAAASPLSVETRAKISLLQCALPENVGEDAMIKKAAWTVAILVVVSAAALGWAYSGQYDVAADEPHWDVTTRTMATIRDRSIEAARQASRYRTWRTPR